MAVDAKRTLVRLGFSDIETDIVLALLTRGAQNGSELAEAVAVDRSTAYRILRKLQHSGIVTSSGQRYDCRYSIDDTEKLVKLGEKQVAEAAITIRSIKKLVLQVPLLSLSQVLNSKVRVFRGEDAIIKVYQEKNRSKDPIVREISNNKVFPGLSDSFWHREIKVRIKNGSFQHQLVDRSDDSAKFHRTSKEQFKEVRMFPDDFVMAAGINIFGNKVAFHNNSLADPLSLIIEDRAMSELMKSFFDFVWNRSQVI